MSDYHSPPSRGEPGRPSARDKKWIMGWPGRVVAGCLLLLLAVGGWAALRAMRAQQVQPPEPITFSYRDRTLQAKEGVPVNDWNPDGFFQNEQGRIQYREGERQARQGIDVSFYQEEIDWAAVAADGVEFAMIRLGYRGYTEGGLRMDSRFEENIQGALAAGIEVGVYFFSQAITEQEALEEAEFVLQALSGYEVTYPVAYDWEVITPGKGARTELMDGQTLTRCALAFCGAIEQAGYMPIIYFNQELGYLSFDVAQLTQYAFWLAEYNPVPNFYYHFDLWQYTHSGTVAGIQGSVDWNLDFRPLKEQGEE